MNCVQEILISNFKKYPEMDVEDFLKLIYQSEFGCGHLIHDEAASYEMLLNEWNSSDINEDEELFERIGGGYARFNVGAARSQGISSRVFQSVFLKSAQKQTGTMENFYCKVKELKKLCNEGILPFSMEEVEGFLLQWERKSYPLFRHSEAYRTLYKPAYRVVEEKYIRLLPLLMKIHSELQLKEKIIIGIDGPCGSGKTTLAQELGDFYNTSVIHMDDFFLPPALRTKERLEEPGGNIHYERFIEEVAQPIKASEEFSYRVFSCKTMDYAGDHEIKPNKVLIIEGSYSMHPFYSSIYDLKVFCCVSKEEQKERIIRRNGLNMYKNFESKWIPLEERYFNQFGIKENCDYFVE